MSAVADYTAPWTLQTASAGWSARVAPSSVAMPDGSIVLMGGSESGWSSGWKNDVWRSTDNGATWTPQTASAGWSARVAPSSVAMSDGSIVLMGGYGGSDKNDVWRSTDNGATWTPQTASAGWAAREFHTSVAMPDSSIVLMGGGNQGGYFNDVWRSTDNGATWTQQTASAGWSARNGYSSVAMSDGSIVLMGGYTPGVVNDVWRSTDNGATWTLQTASAGWSARGFVNSVAMPDGSIVLMGGQDSGGLKNDVWRSTDYGADWTLVKPNDAVGWVGRYAFNSVAMPDGSIVLMGGGSNQGEFLNDVWRFMPAGSPPILDPIGSKSIDEGQQLQFTVSATDPDGDTLTYSTSTLPAGAAFDADTKTFTWTPGFDQAGSYPVTFTVSDGTLTDTEDVTITVNNVNRPPDILGAEPSLRCLGPPNNKYIDMTLKGITDPDGNLVILTITKITSDEATASEKGSGGAKHAPDATVGSGNAFQLRSERSGNGNGRVYKISFTASDNEGGVSSGTVIVCVPHDESQKCSCIDDGQKYDATTIN